MAATNALSDIPLPTLASLLAPITVPGRKAHFTNWGRTFTCRPSALFEPRNEAECALVIELARREGKRVRIAGVGHSPSDLACTTELMLRTTRLCQVLDVDREKRTVVAQGGITLNALHAVLATYGLAMSTLGAISEQTLAGVVATATHGTGVAFGCISTYVRSLTILTADGITVTCSREENETLFMASLCGVGVTGLILRVELQLEDAFRLREVQTTRPFKDVVDNLAEIASSAEHVRLWWFPAADKVVCSLSDRTTQPKQLAGSWWWDTFCGYHVVQVLLYASRFIPALTLPTGRFAAWLASGDRIRVDDSYKVFNVDCRYPQYTTEWALPMDRATDCLQAIHKYLGKEMKDSRGVRPHFPVEIRFSAADDIWLSPAMGQATCWIGIVQYRPFNANVPYRALFLAFEDILAAHGGRPHWAKTHRLRPDDLHALYPRFEDFAREMKRVDAHGMWQNPYTRRHLLGEESEEVGQRVFKKRRE